MYTWKRYDKNGYEVSSAGDKRFSAFYAKMPDGRSFLPNLLVGSSNRTLLSIVGSVRRDTSLINSSY